MPWTYDEVMHKLGDTAQAVPGAILVFVDANKPGKKHVIVGEIGIGGGFSVTPDGLALLGADDAVPVKRAKGLRTNKPTADDDVSLD